jgi:hypothetical protein
MQTWTLLIDPNLSKDKVKRWALADVFINRLMCCIWWLAAILDCIWYTSFFLCVLLTFKSSRHINRGVHQIFLYYFHNSIRSLPSIFSRGLLPSQVFMLFFFSFLSFLFLCEYSTSPCSVFSYVLLHCFSTLLEQIHRILCFTLLVSQPKRGCGIISGAPNKLHD